MSHIDADYYSLKPGGRKALLLALVAGIAVPFIFAALAINSHWHFVLGAAASVGWGLGLAAKPLFNMHKSPFDRGWARGSVIAVAMAAIVYIYLYIRF